MKNMTEGRLADIRKFAGELDKEYWTTHGVEILERAVEVEKFHGEGKGLEYIEDHKTPYRDKIEYQISRLAKQGLLTLYSDSAPMSLYFTVHNEVTGEFKFNGGIIYYKKGDTGVGGPQYSVRLDGTDREHDWQVHT